MAHINDDTSGNSTLGKIVDNESVTHQKTPNENVGSGEVVKDSKEDQKDKEFKEDQKDKESKEKSDESKDNNQDETTEYKITLELLDSIREQLKSFSMELDPNIKIDQQRRQYFESWKKTNRISVGQWDQYDALLHLIRYLNEECFSYCQKSLFFPC